jgi:hypothetical protein
MKVKELIAKLQKEDQEALVVIYHSSHQCLYEIEQAWKIPVRKDESERCDCSSGFPRIIRQASPKDEGALKAVKLSTY